MYRIDKDFERRELEFFLGRHTWERPAIPLDLNMPAERKPPKHYSKIWYVMVENPDGEEPAYIMGKDLPKHPDLAKRLGISIS